jgi:hypothetical protein
MEKSLWDWFEWLDVDKILIYGIIREAFAIFNTQCTFMNHTKIRSGRSRSQDSAFWTRNRFPSRRNLSKLLWVVWIFPHNRHCGMAKADKFREHPKVQSTKLLCWTWLVAWKELDKYPEIGVAELISLLVVTMIGTMTRKLVTAQSSPKELPEKYLISCDLSLNLS